MTDISCKASYLVVISQVESGRIECTQTLPDTNPNAEAKIDKENKARLRLIIRGLTKKQEKINR